MFMFSIQIRSIDSSYTLNLSQIPKIFSVQTAAISMLNKNVNSVKFVTL